MKRAVGISLGSSQRDKRVLINFKGVPVEVERIGTDGDVEKAIRLFAELDGMCGGETILATNTSTLSISGIAERTKYETSKSKGRSSDQNPK